MWVKLTNDDKKPMWVNLDHITVVEGQNDHTGSDLLFESGFRKHVLENPDQVMQRGSMATEMKKARNEVGHHERGA